MSEEEKDYSKENKLRMLVALAILLGADIENDVQQYSKVSKTIKALAEKLYKEKNMSVSVEQTTRMPEREVQIKLAEVGNAAKIELYKIVGTKDNRTCKDCAEWQGKTVTMHPDGRHETVQDFINNHGFHVNCRCSLQPVSVEEIRLNPLNPRYEARKAANPSVYNHDIPLSRLVFN